MYQNDLSLVKLLLHLHNRVRLSWILILLQIRRRFWKINCGWVSERGLRNFRREIIEQLGQKRKGGSDWVLMVADDHRCTEGSYFSSPHERSSTAEATQTHQPVVQHLPCCTHAQYKRSLVRSGAVLEESVRRLSWRKMQRIPQPILVGKKETRTNPRQWKALCWPWQEAQG